MMPNAVATILMMARRTRSERAPANDPYRWTHRPVFVFAPEPAHPELQRQNAINGTAEAAFRERDMVVVTVTGEHVSATLGPPPEASAAELRVHHAVPADAFTVILVGKDGSEKLRANSAVTADQFADMIDAMPMRRQEMRA